jgi:hypothetical protein
VCSTYFIGCYRVEKEKKGKKKTRKINANRFIFSFLSPLTGMWPAHWLVSEDLCWSVGGIIPSPLLFYLLFSILSSSLLFSSKFTRTAEIDIMENLGENTKTIYLLQFSKENNYQRKEGEERGERRRER